MYRTLHTTKNVPDYKFGLLLTLLYYLFPVNLTYTQKLYLGKQCHKVTAFLNSDGLSEVVSEWQ